ncbi:MAG: phosphopantetheine-binding protein [Desulfovibrio sp.]|jgi:acyl carrier protein|nr:phosphopantetheine-binding protein [Desulfovibrio sp.]
MTKSDVLAALAEGIVTELRLEGVAPGDVDHQAPLFGDEGLGLDSLDAVELVVLVEKRFGVTIDDAETAREVFRNLDTLADHILAHAGT